jgi:hypothetical protein
VRGERSYPPRPPEAGVRRAQAGDRAGCVGGGRAFGRRGTGAPAALAPRRRGESGAAGHPQDGVRGRSSLSLPTRIYTVCHRNAHGSHAQHPVGGRLSEFWCVLKNDVSPQVASREEELRGRGAGTGTPTRTRSGTPTRRRPPADLPMPVTTPVAGPTCPCSCPIPQCLRWQSCACATYHNAVL